MKNNGREYHADSCNTHFCGAVLSAGRSILVVRLLKHQDIREFGSHNAGLTNTLRCFGKGCAALTLVGDLAKGIVAVLLSKGICELLGTGLTAQNDVHFIGYIAGIFAILGHVFPIYYHFKGGKGVLVGVSVFLGIDWKVFLCLIVIFAVVLAISKYVSLGSIIAAACCPVVTFLFQFWQRGDLPMWYLWLNTGLAALMGAWVIYMHRTNIQRLKAGNENKFSFHSKKA